MLQKSSRPYCRKSSPVKQRDRFMTLPPDRTKRRTFHDAPARLDEAADVSRRFRQTGRNGDDRFTALPPDRTKRRTFHDASARPDEAADVSRRFRQTGRSGGRFPALPPDRTKRRGLPLLSHRAGCGFSFLRRARGPSPARCGQSPGCGKANRPTQEAAAKAPAAPSPRSKGRRAPPPERERRQPHWPR